jgi:oligopeptide transport system substrate-binding protein
MPPVDRRRLLQGAALGLLGALPLPARSSTGSTARARNVLHRSLSDDATTVDPHKVGFPGETVIISDLFVGLTTLDARARAIAGCAESWTTSTDGLTWTFRLRGGLKWSDGAPLDARDFEYSLRRALAPATAFPYAGRLFAILNARAISQGRAGADALGVAAVDARTVRVTLAHPAPYLPEVLASFGMPVPRKVIEQYGEDWIRPGRFVTNGPFTLAEWRPNAFLKLARNPQFHDAANVRLDEVFHYPIAQASTALRRYQAGELDFVISVPPDQVTRARELFGAQMRVDPGLGLDVIAFNTQSGATRDPRVRRALSLAVDREVLARNLLGDPRVAAYGYVPPGVNDYPNPARADFATWDAARRGAEARRLLAAAGFGPGRPLELRLGYPGNDANRRVAIAIDAMWRAVGVRPQLQAKEQRALTADVVRGDFDAVRSLWLSGFSDPLAFLERLDGSAAGTTMNQSGYRSQVFDAAMTRAMREADLARRAALLREAESVALTDLPVAPLYYLVSRRLVSPRIVGWQNNPRGIHVSRWLSVPKR